MLRSGFQTSVIEPSFVWLDAPAGQPFGDCIRLENALLSIIKYWLTLATAFVLPA